MINFYNQHFMAASRTSERIAAKRKKNVIAPSCKTFYKAVFGVVDRFVKRIVQFSVSGIQTVIPGHFEVLFRYVLNEKFDEIDGGKRPLDVSIVFMPVVVESGIFTIIGVDPF